MRYPLKGDKMLESLVTVLITIYKEENLLCESIQSALDQSFPSDKFEVLLVNNNASSETLKVAKEFLHKFPNRIRMVDERTQGVSSARNAGIKLSRGKYICLLDGDDIMKPNRIQKQIEFLESNRDHAIVCSSYDIFIGKEKKEFFTSEHSIRLPWLVYLFENQKDPFLNSFFVPLPSTLFFEKKTILDAGGFDTFFNFKAGEDIAFSLVMWSKTKIGFINEHLVSYRAKRKDLLNNTTGDHWYYRAERGNKLLQMIDEIYNKGPHHPFDKPLRKIRAEWLRGTSLNYFAYPGEAPKGRYLLMKSLINDPYSLETYKIFLKSIFPKMFYPKVFGFKKWRESSLPVEYGDEFIKSIFRSNNVHPREIRKE